MIWSLAFSLVTLASAPRGAAPPTASDSTCVARDTASRFAAAPRPTEDSATWSPAFKRSVRRHQACVGMSADMLRVAWGLPETIDQHTTGNMVSEEFLYPRYTVVVDNARVVAIRAHSPGRR
jgi:hypothetical protein